MTGFSFYKFSLLLSSVVHASSARAHMCVCVCVSMHARARGCVYVRACVRVCVCVCVCVFMCAVSWVIVSQEKDSCSEFLEHKQPSFKPAGRLIQRRQEFSTVSKKVFNRDQGFRIQRNTTTVQSVLFSL